MTAADHRNPAGRAVTLAVGEHVRVPRTYRGLDILARMDCSGLLDERWDTVDDLVRARHVPSMQLIGAPRTLDLNALSRIGVRLVGRLAGVRDGTAQFAGSLANVCALADLKLGRLLDRIDAGIGTGPGERFAPTAVPAPVLSAPLEGFGAVVWATGFRPDFSFLDAAVFDRKGRIVHDGGVTAAPGLYVMGLPYLRRRRSTLIDGADGDASHLADHLVGRLSVRRAS